MTLRCKWCGMTQEQAEPTGTYIIKTDDGDELTGKMTVGIAHCDNPRGHEYYEEKI